MLTATTRSDGFDRLFLIWDFSGDGVLDMYEVRLALDLILDALTRGLSKLEKKAILRFEAKLRSTYNGSNVKPLLPADFQELMADLTSDISSEKDFHNFVDGIEKAIRVPESPNSVFNTAQQRACDGLFHAWDFDGNGTVDMDELQSVLNALMREEESHISQLNTTLVNKFLGDLRHKVEDPETGPLTVRAFRAVMYELIADLSDPEAFLTALTREVIRLFLPKEANIGGGQGANILSRTPMQASENPITIKKGSPSKKVASLTPVKFTLNRARVVKKNPAEVSPPLGPRDFFTPPTSSPEKGCPNPNYRYFWQYGLSGPTV